jgi:hypothetical protein
MNKLINSVDGVAIDAPADGTAALGVRAHRARSASMTVPVGRAAAHLAHTVEDVERPEIAGSQDAPVSTPALRWER